jgi:hypothetical protein
MGSWSALGPDRAVTEAATKDIDQLFLDLAKSPFRRRFRLRAAEVRYLEKKGMNAVLADAFDLVSKRLGAAKPRNDGKQTPFRGHPAFIRSMPLPRVAGAVSRNGTVLKRPKRCVRLS